MEFKFNIDSSSIEKELQENLTTQMRNAIRNNTNNFFTQINVGYYDKEQYKYINNKLRGDGLKTIDEMIANKFLDPKFQESMNKFFDHNWERIFEECMMRALQHKANGVAFNKLHDLSPMKEIK